MYYPDLSLCDYHRGPCDAPEWRSPLLTIGWLEHPHPFPTGDTPPDLVARLELMKTPCREHYPAYAFRGLHECDLCGASPNGFALGDPRGRSLSFEARSFLNLWIPGKEVIYIAPGLITHYIADHQYLPPAAFIEAVMFCPDFGSPAYLEALQVANQGQSPPLKTKAEFEAERKAFIEETAHLRGDRGKATDGGDQT